jgi:hypothetical protein
MFFKNKNNVRSALAGNAFIARTADQQNNSYNLLQNVFL